MGWCVVSGTNKNVEAIEKLFIAKAAVEKAKQMLLVAEEEVEKVAKELSEAKFAGTSVGIDETADFSWANMSGVDFYAADFSGAIMASVNMRGAHLYQADFYGANLAFAKFGDSNMAWAFLAGANLTSANLENANLSHAYLAGADLTGACLTGAILTNVKWPDGLKLVRDE